MTDERFHEIAGSGGFSVFVDDSYNEPTPVGTQWRMNSADFHDLRVRLATENAVQELREDLATL